MDESQKPMSEHIGGITRAAYEGDIASRLRNWRGLHLAHGGELFEEAAGEIEKLRSRLRLADAAIRSDTPTLTDAEIDALEYVVVEGRIAGTLDYGILRSLLVRLRPEFDRPQPIERTPATQATPAQGTVPPEWTSRPYYVDPPEGWRWGFPRLYDPASDGDMTEWMIANGYPERLARQGLACTFTAYAEDGEK